MLPKHEWLHLAHRLPVGQRRRLIHGHEHTAALTVAHESDRYWAYCQRCKDGGVHAKEHVKLGVPSPESKASVLTVPLDLVPFIGTNAYDELIVGFLQSKGMTYDMLPKLYFSKQRMRICFQVNNGIWMGRDATGNARDKWLVYGYLPYLQTSWGASTAVVTEDAFSMFKIKYTSGLPVDVFSSLGAHVGDNLAVALLQYKRVLMCYDGDQAGYDGARQGVRRMRALGCIAKNTCAPPGKDPKDLTCAEIHALITGAIQS